MRRAILALLALAVAAGAQAGEARLTETAVRAFLARQDAAWNGKDASAFAATFAPNAVFVDQARDSNGGVTVNGHSTLAQATTQARRFFARSKFRQAVTVDHIDIAVDGRSARVLSHAVTQVERPGRLPQSFCAQTEQTLVMAGGRLVSHGQTDTNTRCRH